MDSINYIILYIMNTTQEFLENLENLEKTTNKCIKKNNIIINNLNKQNDKIKLINNNKNNIDSNLNNINTIINKFRKCIIM